MTGRRSGPVNHSPARQGLRSGLNRQNNNRARQKPQGEAAIIPQAQIHPLDNP